MQEQAMKIMQTNGVLIKSIINIIYDLKEFEIRTRIVYEMYRQKVTDFETVQNLINEYYKNPKSVLEKLKIK